MILTLITLLPVYIQTTIAEMIDPHKLYETRCAICHESHAFEFVKGNLKNEGDILVGNRLERDITLILKNHRGTNLSIIESQSLITHFLAILKRDGLYRQKCIICHDKAVNLARQKLILHNGQLYDRYGERLVKTFLQNHGRISKSEVVVIIEMLKRQLSIAQPKLKPEPIITKTN